jgi:hypothetical protein
MKNLIIILTILSLSKSVEAQNYDRDKKCETDTINVDFVDRKFGTHIKYKAFKCTQVSKIGIRFDLAFNRYKYNSTTEKWLGNHNGGTLGIGIIYSNLTFSSEFKPATVIPKKELEFDGQLLTNEAKLNPIKIEYKLAYSINTKHNLALEPYLAYTRNSFIVINEEELNKQFEFSKIHSPTLGIAINKYFTIKDFQFLSAFFKFGYSMTNYQKLNYSLGKGYSDISFGISYKGFIKREFLEKIR